MRVKTRRQNNIGQLGEGKREDRDGFLRTYGARENRFLTRV